MLIKWLPNYHGLLLKSEMKGHFRIRDFCGPGLYLEPERTVVVLPPPYEFEQDPWSKKWPRGTLFNVLVFNCPIEGTAYGYTVPTKYDNR